MKVIIQLQYSLTDSRIFHDVKNIMQSSLHQTQPNPKQPNPPKTKKTLSQPNPTQPNPTQPMDGPNPGPTLVQRACLILYFSQVCVFYDLI